MDTSTLVASILASLSASLGGVWWLSQQLITRRLDKEKDQRQAEIRKEVEVYLGEKSAEREYNLEARKRLYSAIGPLRFQLLVAARDVAARITNYAADHDSFGMNLKGYYGRSTLYRLLRPLAIAELIERQMTYADFSVDPSGVELLRFKKAALTAFTDGDSILDHPGADWGAQREHVFSGTLSRLANVIIVPDEDGSDRRRPMHFHEFEPFVGDAANFKRLSPLTDILSDFRVRTKPIFWIRLVCYAYVCNEYVGRAGSSIGFKKRELDLKKLLLANDDEFTRENIARFEKYFRSMTEMSL